MRKKNVTLVPVLFVSLMAVWLLAGCGGAAPTVTAVQPSSGAGGTIVAITGTGFGPKQGSGKVLFGDANANVDSWTDTAIACTVPSDLKAGDVQVMVNVNNAASNTKAFKITSGSSNSASGDAPKKGEIEHNTPVAAMTAYLKAKGQPTDGYTFAVNNTSASDPNWKIDSVTRAGQVQYFLLHKVNGNWQVVTSGTDFNPQQFGAPADLSIIQPTPPTPQKPNTQAQAIEQYLASKGLPTAGWSLSVAKVSKTDPNWELIKGVSSGGTQYFVLVWNNMLGDWECLAMGTPPFSGVDFKGEPMPQDINSI